MTPKLLTVVSAAALALAAGVGLSDTRPAVAQGGAVHVRAVDLDALVQKSSAAKAILADFQNFQKAKRDGAAKGASEFGTSPTHVGPERYPGADAGLWSTCSGN